MEAQIWKIYIPEGLEFGKCNWFTRNEIYISSLQTSFYTSNNEIKVIPNININRYKSKQNKFILYNPPYQPILLNTFTLVGTEYRIY